MQLELALCAEYRIPHSEFLSWSGSDRDRAIWWYLRERQTCPFCGTRPDEWDPDAGGDRHAYYGQISTCPGCVIRERTQEAPQMKEGRGKRVELIRNPVTEQPESARSWRTTIAGGVAGADHIDD